MNPIKSKIKTKTNYKNKYLKYKTKYLHNHVNTCAIACFTPTWAGTGTGTSTVTGTGTGNNPTHITGTVIFKQDVNSQITKIIVNLQGFQPNTVHGFHIHEYGDLSDGCTSVCAHFNPYNTNHGAPYDDITMRHVGDLQNLVSDSSGCVITEFDDHIVKLYGITNVIGRGLVIHENIDDYGKTSHPLSKTTGNSGARIACAIIGYKKPDL